MQDGTEILSVQGPKGAVRVCVAGRHAFGVAHQG